MRLALILVLLSAAAARAQPDLDPDGDVARSHYNSASQLYDAGDYAGALKEFQAGRALAPRPEFDYNIARCLDRMARWGDAADEYQRYLAGKPDAPDADALRARVRVLRARVAETIVAPAPPLRPRRLRVPAIVVGSLSLVLFGSATGAYLSAYSEYQGDRARCNRLCDPATLGGLRSDVTTAQALGGTLYGLAAAAAIVDVVLWILDWRHAREDRVTRVSWRR